MSAQGFNFEVKYDQAIIDTKTFENTFDFVVPNCNLKEELSCGTPSSYGTFVYPDVWENLRIFYFTLYFDVLCYLNGDCKENEGFVSFMFVKNDVLPQKSSLPDPLEKRNSCDFPSIDYNRDWCDFPIFEADSDSVSHFTFSATLSLVNSSGDLRFPQSFAWECKLQHLNSTTESQPPFGVERFLKRSTLLNSDLISSDTLTIRCEINWSLQFECVLQSEEVVTKNNFLSDSIGTFGQNYKELDRDSFLECFLVKSFLKTLFGVLSRREETMMAVFKTLFSKEWCSLIPYAFDKILDHVTNTKEVQEFHATAGYYGLLDSKDKFRGYRVGEIFSRSGFNILSSLNGKSVKYLKILATRSILTHFNEVLFLDTFNEFEKLNRKDLFLKVMSIFAGDEESVDSEEELGSETKEELIKIFKIVLRRLYFTLCQAWGLKFEDEIDD